jgi:hypothetical protein
LFITPEVERSGSLQLLQRLPEPPCKPVQRLVSIGMLFALSLLSDVERYRIERLGLGVLPLCSFSDQMPQFFISFDEVDQLGV